MPILPPDRGPKPQDVSDEAIDWLVRLHSGTDRDTTTQELEVWLQHSPAHRQAFAEAKELWADLADFADIPASTPAQKTPAPLWPRVMSQALKAVAAILALVVLGTYLPTFLQVLQTELAEYHTARGEQSLVHLPDGTTVHLNTQTAFNVTMTPTHRQITLLKGEANFVVTADPDRPFTVITPMARIQALGTEFTVRTGEDRTTVTVLEHAVAVSQPDQSLSSPSSVTVEEGQRVRVAAETGIGSLETINRTMATAWQHGKLIFDDEPLGQVIAELNRYHAGTIFMMNAELDALKVTGVFNLTDTRAALKTIQQTLPVSNLTITSYVTLLFKI